ncbi:metal ABC transporter permease [Actinoallomurus bryophytorum]|uniref:ABC-type Mn2+/Zn2+ transport system permease subunit n=1 Tax=Actinoallomurus bryophytorum TaxID=1490222 RepID=A0A543CI04_9ACTN|nr:metal ABC transporter permease [Actinoallomurus bryophytorum]TQL96734.1 ABC-type Mn2+/Zn2+ transport system permease subunit [Actinoallomurus bryophytorum]
MTVIERALTEAVLLGAVGGLVSVQIVLRRLPFFTLAMTHATFPGVVLAAVAGVDLYAGGGLFGVLVVAGVLALSRRREDTTTAIGIVLSAGFALGVVLLSAQEGFSKDLTAYTVGQILTVGDGDLVAVALAGLVVVALLGVAGRQLTFRAFDPGGYAAAGYRPVAVDAALLLTVEAVIVVAVPAVGAILAVAILVAPAAVARLWTQRIPLMTGIAVLTGAGSGLAGVLVSNDYNVAAGGAITVAIGVVFALSLAATTTWRTLRRAA